MAPTPPLPVTEDTPPDMLAGSMDLRVVLPNGHSVKMSVERSTPMMDLLVQVTTLNKISTGGHVLQAVGERGILAYKPSTPIGALDAWTIQVVPKLKGQMNTVQKKTPLKPLNQQQPFEQTFRLQVHLPRNQLFVMRVNPRTLLSDILHLTCTEKNLDPNKYELRHPANLSQLLSPSCTVADYGLQEVTVVARSRAPGMGSALSSSDIMALQREEDKRRQQARQQHGAGTGLGLEFNKRNRSSYCDGSISSDSLGGRSISPARSDESASRSASPQAPNLPPMMAPVPPARPARKRRPAPKPPCSNNRPISSEKQMESNVQAESSSGTVVNGHFGGNNSRATHVPVSHSRNSSDSSGYHEASVLSESPAEGNRMSEESTVDTLPHQGKLTSGQQTQMKARGASHSLSRSMSSLSGVGNMAGCQHSTSNSSLASSTGQGQKKKKAPPPPPGVGVTKYGQQQRHSSSQSLSCTYQDTTDSPNKTTSLERHMSGKNSAAASGQSPDKSSTLPGKMKMSQHDYRPVDTSVKTLADTLDIETQSPEEMCLDGDEKISEVERASVPDVPAETSPIHSETHEDELIDSTKNQSSDRDISKTQDECFQQLPVPPVETAPDPPVELASRSKSPQTVDTSTPQGKLVADDLEIGTDFSSWKDTWNTGVVTPTFECKAKHSSLFSSETYPLTPRSSLQLSTLSSVHRRSSDCRIKDYCPELHTSDRKVLSDVHDHKKITPHSKHNTITGQDVHNAVTDGVSRKLPYYNSKQYLCSTIHHVKLNRNLYDIGNKPTLSSCNKITACSSLNLKQKFVNPDSQNFQNLVRRSSNISAQQNSDCMVTSPGTHKHGTGNRNCSSPENVICASKSHRTGPHPVLEQVNCSSVIQQGQFMQNKNCDVLNPNKVSTSCKLGSSMYSSPTVSKWECDVNTDDRQVTPEMRVSLLVPPPADFMVSRSESSQSWKKFLQELDKILENRVEIV